MFGDENSNARDTEAGKATLSFLVSLDDVPAASSSGEMGIFGRGVGEPRLREIPAAVLKQNLRRTVEGLREVFDDLSAGDSALPLQQAQIAIEVTASGGIALVGTTAQVATKGAITLTFGTQSR
ncbi:hypothetical protein ACFYYI_14590 [Streptomyces sp. NPDC002387]|uniref:Pepco domain-containing protein n=1 Tax=Streptomyces sp. NPDC002387 TaxID=3364643 RepID=UPI0036A2BAF9